MKIATILLETLKRGLFKHCGYDLAPMASIILRTRKDSCVAAFAIRLANMTINVMLAVKFDSLASVRMTRRPAFYSVR